jgi:hypothetical protein
MRSSLFAAVASCTVLLFPAAVAAQLAPLAAHWALDEISGTTAADASSNGNDGVLRNFAAAPWIAGKFGNALQFDGVDDYVEITVKGGLPVYGGAGAPYTIAFWVMGAPGQNDVRVFTEGGATSNNPLFTLGTGRTSDNTSDRLQVFIRNDLNVSALNQRSAKVVFDNTWHHVAWVDVAGKGALYIDGVPDLADWDYRFTGTQTRSYGSFTTSRVGLGAVVRPSVCCYFAGALDDFRIYRSALTAVDVGILMANGPHPVSRASLGKLGVGCGDGPLDVHALGTGRLGTAVVLRLHRGLPNSPAFLMLGAQGSPLDLGSAGLQNCALYPRLGSVQFLSLGAVDGSGSSPALTLPIPMDTALASALLSLQGLVVGATATIELSGAIIVQLGL